MLLLQLMSYLNRILQTLIAQPLPGLPAPSSTTTVSTASNAAGPPRGSASATDKAERVPGAAPATIRHLVKKEGRDGPDETGGGSSSGGGGGGGGGFDLFSAGLATLAPEALEQDDPFFVPGNLPDEERPLTAAEELEQQKVRDG